MKNLRTNLEVTILGVEEEDRGVEFNFERHKVHRLIVPDKADMRVGDVLVNETDKQHIYAQVYKDVHLCQPNSYGQAMHWVCVNILDDNLEIMEAVVNAKKPE